MKVRPAGALLALWLAAAAMRAVLTFGQAPASGPSTYFVDFAGGSDDADGRSAQTAFLHSPGDPAATKTAKATVLKAGDTVLFKGGVVYRGTITVPWSGEETVPIVYDGNSSGTFGTGRAVIDGSEPLSGWKRCASQNEALGSPAWQKVWWTTVPASTTCFSCNLCEGETQLLISRHPNTADFDFEDERSTFAPVRGRQPWVEGPVERIAADRGMVQNSTRPYTFAVDNNPQTSAVIDPCAPSGLTFTLKRQVTVASFGIQYVPSYEQPKECVILGDGKQLLTVTLKEDTASIQTYSLPQPATVGELTLKMLSSYGKGRGYAALAEFQAYDAQGNNLIGAPQEMQYADASFFTQSDPRFWDGAYFCIWARPNLLYYQKVLRYVPSEHRLFFEVLTAQQYREGLFVMMNAPAAIDTPGEFALDEPQGQTRRIFVYPLREPGTGGPSDITYAVRKTGFVLSGSHLTVRNFRVQKQYGEAVTVRPPAGSRVKGIRILDTEVTAVRNERGSVVTASSVDSCEIRGNFIHHNRRAAGIGLSGCTDVVISRNHLLRNGATGVRLYGCSRAQVTDNIVEGHLGTHSNGLTAYLGCTDVVFARNRVSGGNNCLTAQEGERMVIHHNILDGNGAAAIGFWNVDTLKDVKVFHNLILNSDRKVDWVAGIYCGGKGPAVNYEFRNNVIDGISTASETPLAGTYSHNIYTRLGWNQNEAHGWKLQEGERYIPDLTQLFVDPVRGNYQPKPGGPLVDAGIAVGIERDIEATFIPQGRAPDIGAYELCIPSRREVR